MAACSQEAEQERATAKRTFAGRSSTSADVRITLLQSGNAIRGYGQLGAEEFALSGVLSLQGPVALSFADGRRLQGHLSVASSGSTITLSARRERISLSTGTADAAELGDAPGPFTGSFAHKDPLGIQLLKIDLSRRGTLLTGTGTNAGKVIGVVATETASGVYTGVILFGDGSQLGMTLTREEGSNDLNLALTSGASYKLKPL